jgi:hypothetical protein
MAASGINGEDLGMLGGGERFKFWDKNDGQRGEGRFNDEHNGDDDE